MTTPPPHSLESDADDLTVVSPRSLPTPSRAAAHGRPDPHTDLHTGTRTRVRDRTRTRDRTVPAERKPWEPSPSVLAEEALASQESDPGKYQANVLPVVYGVRTGDLVSAEGLTGVPTLRRVPPAPSTVGADPGSQTEPVDRSKLVSIASRTLRGRVVTILTFVAVIVASVSGIVAIARVVMG